MAFIARPILNTPPQNCPLSALLLTPTTTGKLHWLQTWYRGRVKETLAHTTHMSLSVLCVRSRVHRCRGELSAACGLCQQRHMPVSYYSSYYNNFVRSIPETQTLACSILLLREIYGSSIKSGLITVARRQRPTAQRLYFFYS